MHIDNIDIRDGEGSGTRIYIFPADESVFENFGNRTNRPHELYAQHVMPTVLDALGLRADVRFTWSVNAGCRMCPCSPGFIIFPADSRDVYVTVSGDDARLVDSNSARAERADRLEQLFAQTASVRDEV